jgi:hypothetical protein
MATQRLLDKLAGRRVIASVSGGKDSAAMSLWLMEQDIDHDRVFLDTKWEHPATYEYLRLRGLASAAALESSGGCRHPRTARTTAESALPDGCDPGGLLAVHPREEVGDPIDRRR